MHSGVFVSLCVCLTDSSVDLLSQPSEECGSVSNSDSAFLEVHGMVFPCCGGHRPLSVSQHRFPRIAMAISGLLVVTELLLYRMTGSPVGSRITSVIRSGASVPLCLVHMDPHS